MSSNAAHGEVYSIQHYVIWYTSALRQVGISSSTNKTDRYGITEIFKHHNHNPMYYTLHAPFVDLVINTQKYATNQIKKKQKKKQ